MQGVEIFEPILNTERRTRDYNKRAGTEQQCLLFSFLCIKVGQKRAKIPKYSSNEHVRLSKTAEYLEIFRMEITLRKKTFSNITQTLSKYLF